MFHLLLGGKTDMTRTLPLSSIRSASTKNLSAAFVADCKAYGLRASRARLAVQTSIWAPVPPPLSSGADAARPSAVSAASSPPPCCASISGSTARIKLMLPTQFSSK